MKMKSLPIVAIPALFCVNSYCSEPMTEKNMMAKSGLSVGAIFVKSDPLALGGKSEYSVLPVIDGYWGPLFINDEGVGSYIMGGTNWGVSLSLDLEGIDNKRGDSQRLSDMPKLDQVVLCSLKFQTEHSWGAVSMGFDHDVSKKHHGYTVHVSYQYPIAIGPLNILPTVTGTWLSHETTNYYYGVQNKYAKPGRARYKPGSATTLNFELMLIYAFNEHDAFTGGLSQQRVSKNISNSPIVGNSHAMDVWFGYVYTF